MKSFFLQPCHQPSVSGRSIPFRSIQWKGLDPQYRGREHRKAPRGGGSGGPRLAPTGAGGPLEMIDSCGGDQSPAGGGAACRYASILRPAPPRRSAYGLHRGQPPGNFPLNRRLEVGAALGVAVTTAGSGISSHCWRRPQSRPAGPFAAACPTNGLDGRTTAPRPCCNRYLRWEGRPGASPGQTHGPTTYSPR